MSGPTIEKATRAPEALTVHLSFAADDFDTSTSGHKGRRSTSELRRVCLPPMLAWPFYRGQDPTCCLPDDVPFRRRSSALHENRSQAASRSGSLRMPPVGDTVKVGWPPNPTPAHLLTFARSVSVYSKSADLPDERYDRTFRDVAAYRAATHCPDGANVADVARATP